jgi:hypothetical protein
MVEDGDCCKLWANPKACIGQLLGYQPFTPKPVPTPAMLSGIKNNQFAQYIGVSNGDALTLCVAM